MRVIRLLSLVIGLIFLLLISYYYFWFLRLPERNIPANNSLFVSPANGVIGSVTYWNADSIRLMKEKYGAIEVWTRDVDTAGWMIAIVMDPTNVHFQRSPVDAKVVNKHHQDGSFNNAVNNDNPYNLRFENEHHEILFLGSDGRYFKTVQIAGFLARRIEDFVVPDQQLKQGEVFGLIKLGSQVAVILPHSYTPQVKTGQVVIDGETVIAR